MLGNATRQLLCGSQAVFEVLSRSTTSHYRLVKLTDYRELAGIREMVFVVL